MWQYSKTSLRWSTYHQAAKSKKTFLFLSISSTFWNSAYTMTLIACVRALARVISSRTVPLFKQTVVVRLAQIWREIETKQSEAADVIFPRHVDVFVLECFPRAGKHAEVSFGNYVVVEIAQNRFHGLVLRVDLKCKLRYFVIFKVERIFRTETVERIVIYASDNDSNWQLSLKNVLLIHGQTVCGHRKSLAFDFVYGILGIRKLESFSMSQRDGGRDTNFAGTKHCFDYADFKDGIAPKSKTNEFLLRTNFKRKPIPLSSNFSWKNKSSCSLPTRSIVSLYSERRFLFTKPALALSVASMAPASSLYQRPEVNCESLAAFP